MTASSGGTCESEGLSPETLAALELGFKDLLIVLDPTTYRPRVTSAATQKPGAAAPVVGRAIRASDLAFPTGNNVYDHSPNAPFNMNMHELRNACPPAEYRDTQGTVLRDVTDPATYRKRMQADSPGGSVVSMMAFGLAQVWSFVVCDAATRARLRAHPLFATQLHTEPHASAFAFRLASFPGRGAGLVAARVIAEGECILREPPLLISVSAYTSTLTAAFEALTGEHMSPRTRAALDALYDCHTADPHPGAGPRHGKVRTNVISAPFPTNETLGATFELASRVNHSCAANLEFNWSYKDFQGSLWATRNIQPGEELTISYLSHATWGAPTEKRRAELSKKHKFKCTCAKCGPL